MPDEMKAYNRPGYEADRLLWNYLEATYNGGDAYKKARDQNGEDILSKHSREYDAHFELRRRATPVLNYTAPVVDKFNALIFRDPPQRLETENKDFLQVVRDANRAKKSLSRFMRGQLRWSAILGEYWTGVDLPPGAGGGVVSRLIARRRGLRPYVFSLDPRRVKDEEWIDGLLVRLVVEHEETTKAGFDQPPVTRRFWREWFADRVILWREEFRESNRPGQMESVMIKVEESPHDFGRVPFFKLMPFEDGKSQIADVAQIQRGILNLTSILTEELYSAVFTWWVLTTTGSVDKDAVELLQKQVLGAGKILQVEGTGITQQSPSNAAQLIREERDRCVSEIYRVSGLSGSQPIERAVVESGVKKLLDMQDAEEVASVLAASAEQHENELLGYIQELGGYGGDAWGQSTYPREFNLFNLKEELDRAFKLMEGKWFPQEFKRDLASDLMVKIFPNASEDQLARWRDGLDGIADTFADALGMSDDEEADITLGVA